MLTMKVLSLLVLVQLSNSFTTEKTKTRVVLGYLTDITGRAGRQVSLAREKEKRILNC